MNFEKGNFISDESGCRGHVSEAEPSGKGFANINEGPQIVPPHRTARDTAADGDRERKLIPTLFMTSLLMCIGMFAYECVKQILFPHVRMWESHFMTIGFSSAAAALVSYFILRRGEKFDRQLACEFTMQVKKAQELRELKRQHELIFASIGEGIHWIDHKGIIVFENPAAARMLGWEVSELIGQPANITVHRTRADGTPYPQTECHIYAALRTGATRRVNNEVFWRKDGTSFPVEYTTTPVRGEKGDIIGAVVVFTDITARKRDEETQKTLAADLIRERQRLDEILNSVPAMVFEALNPEKAGQRASFMSNYVEKMLGYTPEEWNVTPDFWMSRVHPDDRERIAADAAQVYAGRATKNQILRWLAKDGRVVFGEAHLVHLREAGQVIGVRGFILDVTERIQAEEALRESQTRNVSIVESALDCIITTDREGRITEFNPSAEKTFGHSRGAVLGKLMAEVIVPAALREQHRRGMARFFATGETRVMGRRIEITALRADGAEFPIELAITGGITESEQTFTAFIRDITERKQAEADMGRLNKQLVDVSRHAGMAEVATSVLHNVGNVLNSVNVSCSMISATVRKSRLGNVAKAAGLLREHAGDLASFFANDPVGQKLPEFLGKLAEKLSEEQIFVLGELRQLGQNIEHIKDIVAMQQNYATVSGVAEIVNVTDLVEDSLQMNAVALTRHEVQPIREYGEAPSITVDKHKVLQILVNLIRNAKYACDESGRMDKQITVRVAGGHDGVQIAVIDNGVGIPAENLTRIFSHGFTTRKDGHGFGLHSAALAAHEMGGSLTVHSDGPGAGAAFTLALPLRSSGNGRELQKA